MTLDEIEGGSRVFLDSPIFIYHFTGVSADCRRLLERCERREVRGVTSVIVLAEVLHRLMTIEAVEQELVAPGNVPAKLRKRPDLVRRLHRYQDQVERVPLMGIEIESLDLGLLLASSPVREEHGLLTNDSLVVAAARATGASAIATADPDFEGIQGLQVHCPADLQSPTPASPDPTG